MADPSEHSPSGQPIYRHQKRKAFEFAAGDEKNIKRIEEHIISNVGPIEGVFHEIISDQVHLDIHIVPPTEERDFYTLVTSGMSDRPMTVPQGAEDFRYAELLIHLPSDWKISQDDFKDENNYWPLRWLKIAARMPHEYATWLCTGHTLPNGDPPKPFARNTKLCCLMLMNPAFCGDGMAELTVSPKKTIYFHQVFPIYAEEMYFKLENSMEDLLQKLVDADIGDLFDINRKNVCR